MQKCVGIGCPEDTFWLGLYSQSEGHGLKAALPGHPHHAGTSPQNSARQPDGQEVGRRRNRSCVGRGLFQSHVRSSQQRGCSALVSGEHNPALWAAAAAVFPSVSRVASQREWGWCWAQVLTKRAAPLPPVEHTAPFGERHGASSMTAEADDLTAETLEMGVRRRGLSSSCIHGLLRNLWQGISPLCFPSHSSYVLSVQTPSTSGRGAGS